MRSVQTEELKQWLDREDDLLLLNVLDRASFEEEHIPGSHNAPSSAPDLIRKVERLAGSKDRRIVVYCANPECRASPRAVHRLERAGFTNVLHYPGGLEAWKAAGHPVVRGTPAAWRRAPRERFQPDRAHLDG